MNTAGGHKGRFHSTWTAGNLPYYWDSMSGNSSLHVVDIKPATKEYRDVLRAFEKTMQRTGNQQLPVLELHQRQAQSQVGYTSIIRIQRIQNMSLYAQYMVKKKELDKSNAPGHQNEMQLFHGTSADACPKINQQGFNRSFSGKNGKRVFLTPKIIIIINTRPITHISPIGGVGTGCL